MHQGSGFERLSRLFLGQLLCGQLVQLVVDQRQELPGGVRVALLDLVQNPRCFAHGRECTTRRRLLPFAEAAIASFRACPRFRQVAICRSRPSQSTFPHFVPATGSRHENWKSAIELN